MLSLFALIKYIQFHEVTVAFRKYLISIHIQIHIQTIPIFIYTYNLVLKKLANKFNVKLSKNREDIYTYREGYNLHKFIITSNIDKWYLFYIYTVHIKKLNYQIFMVRYSFLLMFSGSSFRLSLFNSLQQVFVKLYSDFIFRLVYF